MEAEVGTRSCLSTRQAVDSVHTMCPSSADAQAAAILNSPQLEESRQSEEESTQCLKKSSVSEGLSPGCTEGGQAIWVFRKFGALHVSEDAV